MAIKSRGLYLANRSRRTIYVDSNRQGAILKPLTEQQGATVEGEVPLKPPPLELCMVLKAHRKENSVIFLANPPKY